MSKETSIQTLAMQEANSFQVTVSDLASAKAAIDYLLEKTNAASRPALAAVTLTASTTTAAESYASIGFALMTHDEYSKLPMT